MANDGFWGAVFGGPPTSVVDYYNRDAQNLAATRLAQIKNALGQIQLNYAPQMAQQAADKGAADVTIEQNKAKYAPQLSALDVQSKQLDNAINSEKFKEMPQAFQATLALKQQQVKNLQQQLLLMPQRTETAATNAAARAVAFQQGPGKCIYR